MQRPAAPPVGLNLGRGGPSGLGSRTSARSSGEEGLTASATAAAASGYAGGVPPAAATSQQQYGSSAASTLSQEGVPLTAPTACALDMLQLMFPDWGVLQILRLLEGIYQEWRSRCVDGGGGGRAPDPALARRHLPGVAQQEVCVEEVRGGVCVGGGRPGTGGTIARGHLPGVARQVCEVWGMGGAPA